MTHHTRQSALGLPYIAERSFEGETFSVSEYTMSEIIASVYEAMAETGRQEGILFLDEINCVSETLTPAILQFLQYKVFGRHQVPQGWVVVTAGNPSEYNRSTHDFDVATWDRLKRIDVEPDYEAWKAYAFASRVIPAIIAYLDAETSDFYHIEATLDGKAFVAAQRLGRPVARDARLRSARHSRDRAPDRSIRAGRAHGQALRGVLRPVRTSTAPIIRSTRS